MYSLLYAGVHVHQFSPVGAVHGDGKDIRFSGDNELGGGSIHGNLLNGVYNDLGTID